LYLVNFPNFDAAGLESMTKQDTNSHYVSEKPKKISLSTKIYNA